MKQDHLRRRTFWEDTEVGIVLLGLYWMFSPVTSPLHLLSTLIKDSSLSGTNHLSQWLNLPRKASGRNVGNLTRVKYISAGAGEIFWIPLTLRAIFVKKKSQWHFIKVLWKAISISTVHHADWKKVVFLAFQALEKVFSLTYDNICLNWFLQSYPKHREQRCERLRSGSEEGTFSTPHFLPGPTTASSSPPRTPYLVCPPHRHLEASPSA